MLTKSSNINLNYAGKICRIDGTVPISGADSIVKAYIGTDTAIVSKDLGPGSLVVFFPCESVLSHQYLSANNLYKNHDLNSNRVEYDLLCAKLDALKNDFKEAHFANEHELDEHLCEIQRLEKKLKTMVGFFEYNGRVRCIKIRGEYSLGFIAPVSTLEIAYNLRDINWNNFVGQYFDSVAGDVVVAKYAPKQVQPTRTETSAKKSHKQFDRIIPNQFRFHYDTRKLADTIDELAPTDVVDISVKVHGTSVILANVLCKKKLNWIQKLGKFFDIPVHDKGYELIYASRRVIKNRHSPNQYYSSDIHGCVARDFGPYIDERITVYGEIVGYLEGENKFIQKNHDYGCTPGTWKFMPYRITSTYESGTVYDWPISKVLTWTDDLIERVPDELKGKIMKLNLLYHGRLGDMYDNLYARIAESCSENDYISARHEYVKHYGELPQYLLSPEEFVIHKWRIAFLECARKDTALLGMELREPLCTNKVPREGVVIRKHTVPAAWKLKSAAHFEFERNQHDAGEWDIEELS